MSRFPSHTHFASWAKVCPGNRQSGGKRRPASTGAGNEWLRSALVEAVLGAVRASRKTPNFFAARYKRLAGHRGTKRAAMAVAHSMLIAIYYMLRDGTHYEELGGNHWDEHHRDDVVRRTTHRLEQLSYSVTLAEAPTMTWRLQGKVAPQHTGFAGCAYACGEYTPLASRLSWSRTGSFPPCQPCARHSPGRN